MFVSRAVRLREGPLREHRLYRFLSNCKFWLVLSTAVPLLTYLIMKEELTPKEINMNAISMFRAGVETVR